MPQSGPQSGPKSKKPGGGVAIPSFLAAKAAAKTKKSATTNAGSAAPQLKTTDSAIPTGPEFDVAISDLDPHHAEPDGEPRNSAGDQEFEPTETAASRRQARRRPAGPVRERLAANDDAPSIGGLIYALQQKPSSKPYQYAAISSVVWVILGAIAWWFVLSAETEPMSAILQKPTTFLMLTAIALPIVVIWFLALLAARSEELRLRSSTMAEVAIRLAEPDKLAEQSTASLGQAVRRQVGFMNDAVSRALGRAGELEALVHNEVSALERSYEENERKIRGLIDELSGERKALLETSGDVHTTLKSLGSEVPALIEKLSTQQVKLAQIIEGAGDNLTMLETSLSQGARQIETSIGNRTDQLQNVLQSYSGTVDSTLNSRTEHLQHVLETYTGAVDNALHSRTEQMQTVLETYTGAVDGALHSRTAEMQAMLSDHTKSLGSTLADTTQEMGSTLDTHGTEMRTMLEDHTGRMGKSLGDTTGQMQGMLETYTGALAEALASRTEEMQEAFEGYMLTLDSSISNRTDNLQSVFEEYAHALDTTLASRAEALDTQLVARTRALDDAFTDRLRLFDETIYRTTSAIDEAVGEKAVALTSALDNHAQNFRETITRQTADIDDTLTNGISAVRRSSENVTKQSLKAIEGLANQSDMLKRVSENLLGQINSVTNRFENQGQLIMQAASALESANYKIDTALKQRHTELSGTLDRLSHKADEFGQFIEGYSTSIEDQLTEAEKRAKATAEQLRHGAQSYKQETLADLERFREEAGAESQRALSDLRNQFSTVSDEVTTQFGNLSNRFDQSTDAVRERAQKATQAIDEEERRLREKLEAIPENTKESAEAMRRALHDQLSALDQLSQITAKQAHDRDISEPMGTVPPAAEPPRVAASSLSASYQREAKNNERPDTDRQLSSLSSSLARELHSRPLRPAAGSTPPTGSAPPQTGSQNPQPANQAAPSQPARPNPGAGNLRNAQGKKPVAQQPANPADAWSLGDLLKRASLDDDGGNEAPATTSTPSPAAAPTQNPAASAPLPDVSEMVGAIDTRTAHEIWTRLRAGQRGIMVPSLYPPAARAAFDDLTRRYRNEQPLREAIGRFLTDFERTVREAEQKDRTGQLVQSHLTSEMGRAYLFLAHVSGRLDA
ncbi:MAG: hypothetical protein K0U74_07185 [Alphaproteobacteria bacterium]|nr:hypothetical protein [Alphaproteobacteria bacterium]